MENLKELLSKLDETSQKVSFPSQTHSFAFTTKKWPVFPTVNQETPKLFKMLHNASSLYEEGQKLINYIYCYRNISISIPTQKLTFGSKEDEEQFLIDINAVMKTKMEKMLEIKQYAERATKFIVENAFIVFKSNVYESRDVREALVYVTDTLMCISYMIGRNSSMLNDFSRLKRENTVWATKYGGESLAEKTKALQNFFSSVNYISEKLRSEIQEKQHFVIHLTEMMSFVVSSLDSGSFSHPEETRAFMRVAMYLVYFMDCSIYNFFRSKNKFLPRLKKLSQKNTIIPLIQDTNTNTKDIIWACGNMKMERDNDWIDNSPEQYSLPLRMAEVTASSTDFLVKIAPLLAEDGEPFDEADAAALRQCFGKSKAVVAMLMEGFRLVGSIQTLLKRAISYKLENRISKQKYKEIKTKVKVDRGEETEPIRVEDMDLRGDPQLYEMKIRHNFSPEDCRSVLKTISFVKELEKKLLQLNRKYYKLTAFYFYTNIQSFLAEQVWDLSNLAKLDDLTKAELYGIAESTCDFEYPELAEKKKKKNFFNFKKAEKTIKEYTLKSKFAFPSQGEVVNLKYIIEKVLSLKKSPFKKKETVKVWQGLFDTLCTFKYFYNAETLIASISDISFLWYKEYNLAFSNCIQFPIEISLPGTLFNYTLKHKSLIPLVFHLFGIYNDSASVALADYKERHLYDEIEAECSLLFDQFLYQFSKILLDKALSVAAFSSIKKILLKTVVSEASGSSERLVLQNLLHVASLQDVCLLGRRINFSRLICQHINHNMRETIDYAVSRFESLGVLSLRELWSALEVIKHANRLVKKVLPIDGFQKMYEETNESVGIYNFDGRVFTSLSNNLLVDFFPNFVYRDSALLFERSSWVGISEKQYRELEKRFERFENTYGSAAKYYKEVFYNKKDIVQIDQIKLIPLILNPSELAFLASEIVNYGEEKILKKIHPYFKAIKSAVPIIKLPPATFGFAGAHTAIELKLDPVANYPPLRSRVMQSLKELGNTLCFVMVLEIAQSELDITKHVFASHLYGTLYREKALGKNSTRLDCVEPNTEIKLAVAVRKIADSNRDNTDLSEKLDKIAESIEKHAEFFREPGGSLLSGFLYSYTKCIYESTFDNDFRGSFYCEPATGLSSKGDLASICNTLKFIVCNSKKEKLEGGDDHEVFGEGLVWALAMLVFALNQTNRIKATDFCSHLLCFNEKDKQSELNATKDSVGSMVLPLSVRAKNFLTLSEKFQSVYSNALFLFRKHYKPPNRFFEAKNGEGKGEWREDDFEERYEEGFLGDKAV